MGKRILLLCALTTFALAGCSSAESGRAAKQGLKGIVTYHTTSGFISPAIGFDRTITLAPSGRYRLRCQAGLGQGVRVSVETMYGTLGARRLAALAAAFEFLSENPPAKRPPIPDIGMSRVEYQGRSYAEADLRADPAARAHAYRPLLALARLTGRCPRRAAG